MKKFNKEFSCSKCLSNNKESIFCSLEAEILKDVSNHKVTNTFKKGQTLFIEGNYPYGIYCISHGNIKLSKVSQEGKETIIRIAKKGDVLGHRSLFSKKQYSATATALEDTTVCFIDKTFILKIMNKNPSIALKLVSKLSISLGQAENTTTSLHQKNVRERLAELLLVLQENHGQKLNNGSIKINLKLTREELASMIGTANETLIRFMTEFKQNNLISQEGKYIIIDDLEQLIDWANLD